MPKTRTETDSFGSIEIPVDALWGAQTARSLHFFAIGTQRMPIEIIHALALIKWAAATVNGQLGLLAADKEAGALGVMVHSPAVSIVTVVPATVQTPVVELEKVTVEPEESLALPNEKVPAPPTTQVLVPGAVQVIVWVALEKVTVVCVDDAEL